ncbi:MAG: hypothetical protein M1832_002659 [Thelocarpon impressellum]|nr:MAG: hypothetical protein M1832_002659 [Thelocarpon impressellum]
MSSSSSRPAAAGRSLPHQIDSSPRVVTSPGPCSPMSPYTPSSATSSSDPSAPGYFGYGSQPAPAHGGNILSPKRFSFRPSGDAARPRSKSPNTQRAQSFSVSTAAVPSSTNARTASDGGNSAPLSPGGRRESAREQRDSGTFTQVGRRSNDWLFGGVSVRETVKGLFEDKK